MKRLFEFFEDSTGRASSSRLLVIGAFLVSAPLTWKIGTSEALGIFLGAFVINYAAGKTADIFMAKKDTP